MTDRQYNSKLLGDKLSQLPVPPNEALWSRIEAQLLVVPPLMQHPPAKALPPPKGGITIGVKATIAIVVAVLSAMLVLWLVYKKTPPQQHTPTLKKVEQHPIVDSTKATAPVATPVQPVLIKEPLVKPAPQPAPLDTEAISTPLLPQRKAVDLPLRDTAPAITPPASAAFWADSVKLPTPKKDEGYYFEIKKKKG